MKDSLLKFGRTLMRIELPEIPDAAVFVRGLSAGERLVIEEVRKDGSLVGDHEFCFLGAFDEKGERLFTAEEAKNLDGRIAGKIARAVLVASGLAADSAETAAKNSESSPS